MEWRVSRGCQDLHSIIQVEILRSFASRIKDYAKLRISSDSEGKVKFTLAMLDGKKAIQSISVDLQPEGTITESIDGRRITRTQLKMIKEVSKDFHITSTFPANSQREVYLVHISQSDLALENGTDEADEEEGMIMLTPEEYKAMCEASSEES